MIDFLLEQTGAPLSSYRLNRRSNWMINNAFTLKSVIRAIHHAFCMADTQPCAPVCVCVRVCSLSAAGGEIFNQCVSDRDDEAFSEEDVKRLMRQILEGVSFLHQNDVVHLDLKVSRYAQTQFPVTVLSLNPIKLYSK